MLTANGGATACMSYVVGAGGTAAIQYSRSFNGSGTPGKIVYMGFGFETILSQTACNTVMSDILSFFSVGAPVTTSGVWAE